MTWQSHRTRFLMLEDGDVAKPVVRFFFSIREDGDMAKVVAHFLIDIKYGDIKNHDGKSRVRKLHRWKDPFQAHTMTPNNIGGMAN